jgi:hypothetical protein
MALTRNGYRLLTLSILVQGGRLAASGKLPSGAGSNRSGIESSEGGSWVDQLAKVRDGDLVYLIRGKDAGRPAWHYVQIDGMKLRAFKRALATGSLDVSQYGEILKSGWGEDPPGDIVKWVKDRYG